MQPTRRLALLAASLAFALGAQAQSWPDKPITFIVPFAAGSATDQLARALGQAVTEQTKQSVVIDNKPGANAFIGAQAAAKAPKDGYTVLITTNTTHAANEHLFKKLPYDPVKDFAPVTLLSKGGQILVVNNDLPVRNVQELVKLAKEQPGKLSFGYGSSSSRIAGELFKQMTGTYIVGIPYRSNPPAVTDLIGGQIQFMITDMATGLPQAKAGKVRPLGVSTAKRTELAPELPTISEAGVKNYEMSFWFAAYVPEGTPAPVVARLNDILVKANKSQTVSNFYAQNGFEAITGSPEDLHRFQLAESTKRRKIIESAGIAKE
ncbi:tripartite tricarboxylate transporter substrate binding protein [Ramlibacter sp. USB13]|uniref:Tripartite tricarboxylate transporter substrate binding protein n=1 Tax=Ramlibacter cellulosilyticus TaxID=2764187 RepID=A0A923S932_9BURK|nr:tripartite tricarboxylate transporter substrate binding protein [Ramlibacter cellulosilyticus]MBC5781329.1 tripartite tricarboxylate transporter substrate binding protein [Ramlibacter cellulosilyticus]